MEGPDWWTRGLPGGNLRKKRGTQLIQGIFPRDCLSGLPRPWRPFSFLLGACQQLVVEADCPHYLIAPHWPWVNWTCLATEDFLETDLPHSSFPAVGLVPSEDASHSLWALGQYPWAGVHGGRSPSCRGFTGHFSGQALRIQFHGS